VAQQKKWISSPVVPVLLKSIYVLARYRDMHTNSNKCKVKKLGKMESNTKTSNKESQKKAWQCCNNRKKETTEEANNWNKIIAEKKAEKQKLETT